MSNLLEQASLVMIPSGYAEDIVYSEIPIDGAGDLSFTRASNGTRINFDGLVEVVPWNLLDYSEAFVGGGWGTDGTSTATDNFTTAPNGTLTAAKVVANVASGYAYKGITLTEGVYTFSLYVKASASTTIALNFDTTTSSKNITTEWQRFDVTHNVTSAGTKYVVYAGLATGVNYFVWGAQVNIGSTAKPYFPTTDRLNVPRLTYQNGGGGCPSLLLEKQSSNQFLRSQEFDNATWIKGVNLSVTANSIVSPDGTQNADTVTNSYVDTIYIYQLSQVQATTWTTSFYAKKGTNKYLGIAITAYSYVNERYQPVFNLDNGTIQAQNTSGSNVTNTSCSITPVGNGWYRITATGTFAAGSDYCYAVLQSSNNTNYQPDTATGSLDWTNATNGNAYLWGAQIEASSYPTSYIPTTSASATRVADACELPMGTLLAQSNWTIFFDHKIVGGEGGSAPIYSLYETSADNVFLYVNGNAGLNLYMPLQGGYVFGTGSNNGFVPNQRSKVLLKYNGTTIKYFINGVLYGSASATLTYTQRALYYETGGGKSFEVNETVFFPTALTDAECITLTTI